jgi:hypothetical protein
VIVRGENSLNPCPDFWDHLSSSTFENGEETQDNNIKFFEYAWNKVVSLFGGDKSLMSLNESQLKIGNEKGIRTGSSLIAISPLSLAQTLKIGALVGESAYLTMNYDGSKKWYGYTPGGLIGSPVAGMAGTRSGILVKLSGAAFYGYGGQLIDQYFGYGDKISYTEGTTDILIAMAFIAVEKYAPMASEKLNRKMKDKVFRDKFGEFLAQNISKGRGRAKRQAKILAKKIEYGVGSFKANIDDITKLGLQTSLMSLSFGGEGFDNLIDGRAMMQWLRENGIY